MNFLNLDLKKIILILFVIGLPLVSINMQRNPEETPWYAKPFTVVAGLVQNGFVSFASSVRHTTLLYVDLIKVKKVNQELAKQNSEFREQLDALTEIRIENVRLTNILNFKQRTAMQILPARVVAKDLTVDRSTIRINRGSRDGVKPWQAVITVEGVVGYTLRVDAFSSIVLVLTDRYAVIDALVQKNRIRALVEGRSKDSCRLRYLARGEYVTPGDVIVTGGLDDIFPKGFPIASVVNIKPNASGGISQEIELKPAVQVQNVEEVMVILNAAKESFLDLQAAEVGH